MRGPVVYTEGGRKHGVALDLEKALLEAGRKRTRLGKQEPTIQPAGARAQWLVQSGGELQGKKSYGRSRYSYGVPAGLETVVIEIGNLSNDCDFYALRHHRIRQEIAQIIAQGLVYNMQRLGLA